MKQSVFFFAKPVEPSFCFTVPLEFHHQGQPVGEPCAIPVKVSRDTHGAFGMRWKARIDPLDLTIRDLTFEGVCEKARNGIESFVRGEIAEANYRANQAASERRQTVLFVDEAMEG